MKCPKCDNEMVIKNKDVSTNSGNGKKYDRVVCWCEKDDIWINIEIPQEI